MAKKKATKKPAKKTVPFKGPKHKAKATGKTPVKKSKPTTNTAKAPKQRAVAEEVLARKKADSLEEKRGRLTKLLLTIQDCHFENWANNTEGYSLGYAPGEQYDREEIIDAVVGELETDDDLDYHFEEIAEILKASKSTK